MTVGAAQDNDYALKFTPELGRQVCAIVRRVGFEKTAAELARVHRNTLRNWRERGERGEEPFVEFALDLAQAKAQFIEQRLERVEDDRWVLERLDRDQFSTTQKHELTGKDGGALEHDHKVTHSLSREQSVEIVAKILGVERQLVGGKFKGRQLEQESEGGDE